MQISSISIFALLGAMASAAPVAQAPKVDHDSTKALSVDLSSAWQMITWTGTGCMGTPVWWSNPATSSCTNFQSVSSLKVTNLGGCSTTYFTGNDCQGSSVHVDEQDSCDGYTQGERIQSFSLNC